MAELRRDDFLGGRLRIWQPVTGYRAGIDPVLLAAAVPAQAGETVLELGLGGGVASLCLMARVPGLTVTGVELQPVYADLARRNAAENGHRIEVVEADLTDLPEPLRSRTFDHVLANPPYFRAAGRIPAADPGREAGRGERLPLAPWVQTALRRLRPGGWLTMIQDITRLPDLLAVLPGDGTIVHPLSARAGRDPRRLILHHRKGSRAAFRLAAPLALHEGPVHLRDGDDYARWADDCLRNAAAFPAVPR